MNIVLLSGGSGQRLWPLSNDIHSKQFLKLFQAPDESEESMVQRMYRGFKEINADTKITIATSKEQVPIIHEQLGTDVAISVEPCRRDTFPAIALAVAYLKDKLGVNDDEVVVVCPVDPYVEKDYFEALKEMSEVAAEGSSNLTLLGMEPTEPSEKFGYIIPKDTSRVSKVEMFKEKPNREVAKGYLKQGALWNGGVFAFKLGFIMKRAHELIDFNDYDDLFEKYDTLQKISFDYAVVEKEENIRVIRFSGTWNDLGTWSTLTDVLEKKSIGNVVMSDSTKNTCVINKSNIPVLCMGASDLIVVINEDGILITTKQESEHLKEYVEKLPKNNS